MVFAARAVDRHVDQDALKSGLGKEKEEVGLKRGRSDSTTLAQRVPLGPGRGQAAPPVTNIVNARILPQRRVVSQPTQSKRSSKVAVTVQIQEEIEVKDELPQSEMEVEEPVRLYDEEDDLIVNEQEVEAMVGVDNDSEVEDEEEDDLAPLPLPHSEAKTGRVWPEVATERAKRYQREIQAIRERFEDEVDMHDTTMVSEYSDEIFEYMADLEVCFVLWGRGIGSDVFYRRRLCLTPIIWTDKTRFRGRCGKRSLTGFCKCTCDIICCQRRYG